MTDIEIAQSVTPIHIKKFAEKINISEDDLELYGKFKAKLPLHLINEEKIKSSKLILVTTSILLLAGFIFFYFSSFSRLSSCSFDYISLLSCYDNIFISDCCLYIFFYR